MYIIRRSISSTGLRNYTFTQISNFIFYIFFSHLLEKIKEIKQSKKRERLAGGGHGYKVDSGEGGVE